MSNSLFFPAMILSCSKAPDGKHSIAKGLVHQLGAEYITGELAPFIAKKLQGIDEPLNNKQMLAWLGVSSLAEITDDKKYLLTGLHLRQWMLCYAALQDDIAAALVDKIEQDNIIAGKNKLLDIAAAEIEYLKKQIEGVKP